MKVFVIIGTRPEVIKLAPVVDALRRQGLSTCLVGTGQHHDWKMLGSFLRTFQLDLDHQLQFAGGDLLGSFVDITAGLGALFQRERPALVLAQGDTTTTVAAAFAARKSGCPFGHVEAGLRAFSRELPEEEHRICADTLADLLFAPTRIAHENLVREHVNGRVFLSGNTVLDALRQHPPRAAARRQGVLVTIHRQETVDHAERFGEVLAALGQLGRRHEVVWPMHPRARAKLAAHGLVLPPGVRAEGPLGYTDFLARLSEAEVVVTDSGGVQEEAAILGTPCVSVRNFTERPETLIEGVGRLAGVDREGIVRVVGEVLKDWAEYGRCVPHLYGDGRAGEKIARACADFLAARQPQQQAQVAVAAGGRRG